MRIILDTSWWENVGNLQMDITSHCNARCAFCVRQVDGTTDVKPELPLEHFDLDIWKRLVTEDTRGMLIKELTLNGNWGDPMMHPHLVEMLDIFSHYHPETNLFIHTNGSMRSIKFWEDMASSCRKFANHVICFAVDGMEDTHSIYRVRTKWHKLMENITAFASKGGRARGIMTVFKHNQHQVEEVKEAIRNTGAIEFETRPSHGAHTIQAGVTLESVECETEQHRFDELEVSMSDLRDFELYDKIQYPKVVSKCPWFADRRVQIDPWGTVWPCCHVSFYGIDYKASEELIEKHVDSSFYGARNTNNLHNHTLNEVLNNDWYNETLYNAVDEAKWKACRDTCGVTKNG